MYHQVSEIENLLPKTQKLRSSIIITRVRVRLEHKVAHPTKGAVLNTDQLCIVICFLNVTKIYKWAIKNRAFWNFKVNSKGQKPIKSYWKWFFIKNLLLEQQLLLRSHINKVTFKKLYLVNLCPIFVGSFENLGDS